MAEKVIRVEIFGVETSIMARDLAWDWIGDAHDRFSVGDQILVRITGVWREGLEDVGVRADVKSVGNGPQQLAEMPDPEQVRRHCHRRA